MRLRNASYFPVWTVSVLSALPTLAASVVLQLAVPPKTPEFRRTTPGERSALLACVRPPAPKYRLPPFRFNRACFPFARVPVQPLLAVPISSFLRTICPPSSIFRIPFPSRAICRKDVTFSRDPLFTVIVVRLELAAVKHAPVPVKTGYRHRCRHLQRNQWKHSRGGIVPASELRTYVNVANQGYGTVLSVQGGKIPAVEDGIAAARRMDVQSPAGVIHIQSPVSGVVQNTEGSS